MSDVKYTAAVITVSDRSARGERADASGPALAELLRERGYEVVHMGIVPDERRDIERMAPGIPEAMRAASMAITPRGCLSRAAAGIVDRTLIVNLPGSPKAARENIEAVIDALDHGLLMLRGGPADCAADTTKPTARG